MADISNNKSFCVRLWTHLTFECNGDVSPCCLMHNRRDWQGSTALGNTSTSTLKEMWNSDSMKEMRKKMLAGEQIDVCGKCYDKEKSGGKSARQHINNFFSNKIDKAFNETKTDGYYEDLDLIFWDVRFSNKCNFKCRMCGPHSSSAWVADKRKMTTDPKLIRGLAQQENIDGKKSLEYLKENAHKVERILFAGGEPLIMDEHYQLMEHLISINNFCMLTYHTNMSKLHYKNWDVMNMWSAWPENKISVAPSIDEIGPRAELIRCGTVWADVEKNLKTVVAAGIKMQPNITVNAMNINRIPELLTYLYDIGVISEKYKCVNFSIGNVYWPVQLRVCILPDDFKTEIKNKIINFVADFKTRTGYDIMPVVALTLTMLNEPHDPTLAKKFIEYTAKLDEIRNENTYEVIPELKRVRDLYE
jgi:hypothetical protein